MSPASSGSRWTTAYPALLLVTVLSLSTQAGRVAAAASAAPLSPASSLSTPKASLQGATLDLTFEQTKIYQVERLRQVTSHTPSSSSPHTQGTATQPASTTTVTVAPGWAVAMPADTASQPCHATTMFVANISEWSVPPGCYADIYTFPSTYSNMPGFGYCNWWPQALHPNDPGLLDWGRYKTGSVPIPGAVVYEAPDVQGAGPDGHYAQVVAVAPGGYWMLITEMNFSWRGGGFGRVDYRYIHVGQGITFIYA